MSFWDWFQLALSTVLSVYILALYVSLVISGVTESEDVSLVGQFLRFVVATLITSVALTIVWQSIDDALPKLFHMLGR